MDFSKEVHTLALSLKLDAQSPPLSGHYLVPQPLQFHHYQIYLPWSIFASGDLRGASGIQERLQTL